MNREEWKIKCYKTTIDIIKDYFDYRYLLVNQEQNKEDVLKVIRNLEAEIEAIDKHTKQSTNK